MWCQPLPQSGDRARQELFLPLSPHVAHQRSCRIPMGYDVRCCPRGHVGWNVPSLDQQEPHHFDVFARLRTGLGWIVGSALPSHLPPDL